MKTDIDTPVQGSVLDNDVDPDGDVLTASLVRQPRHGTVTLNEDGTYTYTPDDGFSGSDRFVYEVDDGNGGTDRARVRIVVEPDPNENPVAVRDVNTTEYESSVSGNVLDNDVDSNGDSLTASLVRQPANGTVTLNEDGTYTYTPEDGFSGRDRFVYEVDDGNGGTDRACVRIIVQPNSNEAPDAVKDSNSTEYETTVTGRVLCNDVDPDGDSLTATLVRQPRHGTVSLNEDGTYTYTPDNGFSGWDGFVYEADDGNGGTDRACVRIAVQPAPNDNPDARDDSDTTPFNTPVDGTVTTNDSDPNGDVLSYTLVSGAGNGSVTLTEDGGYTYTPDADFSGLDTFVYEASDGNGGTDTAVVTIEVEPAAANENPDAVKDYNSTDFETTVTGRVLCNDVDPDGDALSATLLTPPQNGTVTVTPNGRYEYTPNAGFSGQDTFVYEVSDGNGGTDTAEVCIDVGDPPDTLVSSSGEPPQAETASIGNRVWIDADGDGIQGTDEEGRADVTVELRDADGQVLATTTTNSNGEYLFEGLTAGDYSITVQEVEGFDFTAADTGDDTTDSDVNVDGQTATVTLAAGENNRTVDAGLVAEIPEYNGVGGEHWGDPHFRGDDGGRYDVQGKPGHVYNMLSDGELQYNAKFKTYDPYPDATVVGEAGIMVGSNTVHIVPWEAPVLNGEAIEEGTTVYSEDGKVAITWNWRSVMVSTPEYDLEILSTWAKGIPFLNGVYKAKDNPFADGIDAHGLWGQTVDSDTEAVSGDLGTGAQGGGALETIDSDGNVVVSEAGDLTAIDYYEMTDLFSRSSVLAEGEVFLRSSVALTEDVWFGEGDA